MHANFLEPEELLAEESFYHWYMKSDEAAIAQWDSWMKQDPAHQRLAAEAVRMLNELKIQEGAIPAQRMEAAYEKLQAASYKPQEGGKLLGLKPRRRWKMIAAAAIILAVAGLGIMKYTGNLRPSAETQYGQILEKNLPDGSEVTLNAHSKISYFNRWQDGKDREVWLNGEAFFHVRKTQQKSRFIVHTNRFDIIVTGTQFNVINRDGVTNVLLKEGSVTLRTCNGKLIYMKPGDFVDVNDSCMGKKTAETANIVAWKERKMVFDKTPMPEVAKMITAHYGVQVVLQDSVAAKAISGIMLNDNLDVLLSALELTQDFTVERNGNTIVIKSHL